MPGLEARGEEEATTTTKVEFAMREEKNSAREKKKLFNLSPHSNAEQPLNWKILIR